MASPIAAFCPPAPWCCYLRFGVYPTVCVLYFKDTGSYCICFFSQYMVNVFPSIFQHILSTGYLLAQYLIEMFLTLFKPLLLDNEVQIFCALVN